MPFKTILRELVESVPGASGAILADWEGEAVDCYSLFDDYELKIIGAHKGIILNRIKDVQKRFGGDDPREVVISTEKRHLITGAIGPDYSLVLTLAREAVIGQALYRFRKSVVVLEKEIY